MKKLMILALFVLFSGCSLEDMPVSPEANGEYKTVTVPISAGAADTRIAVDDGASTSSSWKFEWEADEDVSVWYSGCAAFAKFEMDEFDEDLSTFKGEILTSAKKIRVISPYDEEGVINGSTYSIDISEQDGDLGKLYMMSEELIEVSDTEISGTAPEMKHLGSFLAIYFELVNAEASYTYEITKVMLSGVPTTMDVDMTASFDNNDYYSNMNEDVTITATLSDKVFGEDDVEVRLNMLPFSFELEDVIIFEITYKYNDVERITKLTLENTTEAAIPFERAKFNYCTITLDGTGELTVSGATINGWVVANGSGEVLDTQPLDEKDDPSDL